MRNAFTTMGKLLVVIVALPLAILAGLFGSAEKRSADDVASYLRDFIEGNGGDWDWDDFTSVPIADPQLESIRKRAAAVELPATQEGINTLRDLLAEVRRLAQKV